MNELDLNKLDDVVGGVMPPPKNPDTPVAAPKPIPPWFNPRGTTTGPATGIPIP